MTRHAYPGTAMFGDYLRAAAGFVPAAAILATTPVGTVAASVLTGVAALFLAFGVRTAVRHGTRIEVTEQTIRASGPLAGSITWSELDGIKLSYYSIRRDKSEGWLQLELRAGQTTMRLDSRIEGFAALAERAARAAEARGLALNAATAANLGALGLRTPAAVAAILDARGGAA